MNIRRVAAGAATALLALVIGLSPATPAAASLSQCGVGAGYVCVWTGTEYSGLYAGARATSYCRNLSSNFNNTISSAWNVSGYRVVFWDETCAYIGDGYVFLTGARVANLYNWSNRFSSIEDYDAACEDVPQICSLPAGYTGPVTKGADGVIRAKTAGLGAAHE